MPDYKVVNGVNFDKGTPDAVVNALLHFMKTRQRIRVFYGDTRTGLDWGEEYDTMGYVGKSMGATPIPLLINNSRSMGGSGILTGRIVRITVDRQNVYIHPRYHIDVKVNGKQVYKNGELYANCQSNEKAVKLARFLTGQSNVRG